MLRKILNLEKMTLIIGRWNPQNDELGQGDSHRLGRVSNGISYFY